MSDGWQKLQVLGNLGADPELKYGQSGDAVLRMRLAANESWVTKSGERGEHVEWMTVVFFGKRAEGLAKHLGKGDRVFVEGRLRTREWEDKDGQRRWTTEVIGLDLRFAGGGGQRASGGYGGSAGATDKPRDDFPADSFGDDDVPF